MRGIRIEPEGIEAALRLHPSVSEAAVAVRHQPIGDILEAFVVGAGGGLPHPNRLRDHLRRILPEHMVPARIRAVGSMPLSPHGKLDRAALLRLEILPETGRNKYHLHPLDYVGLFSRGSCTNSTLNGFSAAVLARFVRSTERGSFAAIRRGQEKRLKALLNYEGEDNFECFFGPSGSDLAYLPLMFARILHPGQAHHARDQAELPHLQDPYSCRVAATVFRRLCPGKEQALGQDAFFRSLEHCQGQMPKGSCSGEIIAGNEPIGRTMEAIDHITGVGAFPTVCVFRPLAGSAMEDEPPPRYEEMRRVMKHMWERCRDRGVPIGLAPNVEVSLVVQPTDAAYLADGTLKDRWYMWKLGLLRVVLA